VPRSRAKTDVVGRELVSSPRKACRRAHPADDRTLPRAARRREIRRILKEIGTRESERSSPFASIIARMSRSRWVKTLPLRNAISLSLALQRQMAGTANAGGRRAERDIGFPYQPAAYRDVMVRAPCRHGRPQVSIASQPSEAISAWSEKTARISSASSRSRPCSTRTCCDQKVGLKACARRTG